MSNPQRYYRNVSTIEEAHLAIRELTDHVYDLRGQVDGHKATIDGLQKQAAATLNSGLNTQIAGIAVKSVTDPSSLKNGYTIRYNTATGQFEFGV